MWRPVIVAVSATVVEIREKPTEKAQETYNKGEDGHPGRELQGIGRQQQQGAEDDRGPRNRLHASSTPPDSRIERGFQTRYEAYV
jgi:hypothetical protein